MPKNSSAPDSPEEVLRGEGHNIAKLPLSPGQRLKTAREKAGLSIEETASLLFLQVSFIRYLENDEYDRLPGPTFIKGYIKAYGRLVSLPVEPLIVRFNETYMASDSHGSGEMIEANASIDAQHGSLQSPATASMQKRRLGLLPHAVIIVIVLAAIVVLVLQEGVTLPEGVGLTTETETTAARLAVRQEEAGGSTTQAQTLPPVSAEAQGNDVAVDKITVSPEVALIQQGHNGSLIDKPLQMQQLSGLQAPDGHGWAGAQLAGMHIEQVQPEKPGMVTAYRINIEAMNLNKNESHPNRLRLAFLETADVYVEDGAGVSAHSETHSRGSEVQVALLGPPPYLLALSASGAVAVRFNDRPVVLPASRKDS